MTYNKEQQIVVDHIKPLLDLLPILEQLKKQVLDHPTNLTLMADTTFICRKCGDILEEIGKRLNEVEYENAKQAVQIMLAVKTKNHKTETCTISDNSSPHVKFPQSPKEDGYDKFVEQLPLTAMRPHYPTVCDLIASELEKGNKVPYGLKDQILSWNWKLRVTSRRGL